MNKNLNLSSKRTDKIDDFLIEIKGKKKVHIEKDLESPIIISEFSWLLPGLIVKIKDKSLDFLNKKAVVRSVEGFAGVVEVIEGGENLKIDQKMLETVIPVSKLIKKAKICVFFIFFSIFFKKIKKNKKNKKKFKILIF